MKFSASHDRLLLYTNSGRLTWTVTHPSKVMPVQPRCLPMGLSMPQSNEVDSKWRSHSNKIARWQNVIRQPAWSGINGKHIKLPRPQRWWNTRSRIWEIQHAFPYLQPEPERADRVCSRFFSRLYFGPCWAEGAGLLDGFLAVRPRQSGKKLTSSLMQQLIVIPRAIKVNVGF